ncbi:uncharacterized protein [Tenebrio molitor]|uniref:uncharacterized protein n=1 Tax=Tenebrio molitor TaxID=7067 RepID=UPI0036249035
MQFDVVDLLILSVGCVEDDRDVPNPCSYSVLQIVKHSVLRQQDRTGLTDYSLKSHYSRLALIPSVLQILLEVDLLTYGFYTLIVVGLMKRNQWSLLIRNLERVECEVNNKKSLYWIFFVSNAIYFGMIAFTFYVWVDVLVLKETVDHFNDIFGWAILLNIFFASLRGLIYLDNAIKGADSIDNVPQNYWQMASHIFVVLFYWIGIFALILWCDTIRKEFEELLSYCYQMQTCIAESTFTENDMCIFTKSVSQSMPEFTAARYFSIDRSTIFSILNSITTFLLVMIQFKSL